MEVKMPPVDSPEGYPQTPPYDWWRRHDEYEPTGSEATSHAAPR